MRFWRDETGQGLVEYALIIAVIAIAVIVAMLFLRDQLSNLFSNVPWVLLSLGVVPKLLDPERGWLVLALASTLAGNLTIFGSVANLIVLELAGKHGRIGFARFLRSGVVITTATLLVGILVILVERALGW